MKHPNHALPNRSALYLGKTGSGKSQAAKQSPDVPGWGGRLLLLDHAHDHPRHADGTATVYASTPATFRDYVVAAVRSGRGFRIGYDGPRSPELLEWFARYVVAPILDGRTRTGVLIEELPRWVDGPGRASPAFGLLLEEGRKYGLGLHMTAQRPQGIPKAAYDAAGTWWIGQQQGAAREYILREKVVTADQLDGLKPLEFLRYTDGAEPPVERVALRYIA